MEYNVCPGCGHVGCMGSCGWKPSQEGVDHLTSATPEDPIVVWDKHPAAWAGPICQRCSYPAYDGYPGGSWCRECYLANRLNAGLEVDIKEAALVLPYHLGELIYWRMKFREKDE